MRAVVQRVTAASVRVDGQVIGAIGPGLLVLAGVGQDDTDADAAYLASKISTLRVFPTEGGKPMDRSVIDIGGSLLVVSQFTLYGDARGQRRPSFTAAAPPDAARRLYEGLVQQLRATGVPVETGEFQADMQVELTNDGPVTILLDSGRLF